jgi:phosphonate metabolism protein (transferase hexapeptide repeat family)
MTNAPHHPTRLGPAPLIDPTATVCDAVLGRYTEVGARTSVTSSTMGDYSYVVNDSDITGTKIGKFCSIAAMTRINPGNHPMTRATQSHMTYRASWYFAGESDDEDVFAWRRAHPVTIGHDVWIGHGAIILPGVTIATGAVIAAGAVVTHDVAAYIIAAGVPATPLRPRATEALAHRLERLAWWDWDHERLRHALPDFRTLTIEAFLDKYEPNQPGQP